jgi:hypothetical protein
MEDLLIGPASDAFLGDGLFYRNPFSSSKLSGFYGNKIIRNYLTHPDEALRQSAGHFQ